MKKYGYRNISNRDEISQSADKQGHHDYSNNSGKHVTRYDFINWGDQTSWGIPGQTRYEVKGIDDLLNASQKVNSTKQ